MNRTALLASVAVAVLGFVLLALYVRQFQLEATGGKPVEVLTVTQDLSAGEPLAAEALATRAVPEAYVEDRHLRQTELARVIGVKLAVPIRANQSLLSTDLETAHRQQSTLSNRIRKGMRAMTVEAPRGESFNELIRPGDRVDVLLTKVKPGTESKRVTVPLLQNLLVLAVGSNVSTKYQRQEVERSRSRAVTVSVTIEQATLLAQAQRGDSALRLILRNEGDVEILEGLAETDDSDVLEAEKRAQRQRVRIERVD